MCKVMKSFVCRGCLYPVGLTGIGCTNVDNGVKANLELMDKFCYLGDMLSVHKPTNVLTQGRGRGPNFISNRP